MWSERCIVEVLKTILVGAIVKETNLMMAKPTLNNRQKKAVEKIAVLPDTLSTRRIVANQQILEEEDKQKEEEYQEGFRKWERPRKKI